MDEPQNAACVGAGSQANFMPTLNVHKKQILRLDLWPGSLCIASETAV
jgi:hypothetical protein